MFVRLARYLLNRIPTLKYLGYVALRFYNSYSRRLCTLWSLALLPAAFHVTFALPVQPMYLHADYRVSHVIICESH